MTRLLGMALLASVIAGAAAGPLPYRVEELENSGYTAKQMEDIEMRRKNGETEQSIAKRYPAAASAEAEAQAQRFNPFLKTVIDRTGAYSEQSVDQTISEIDSKLVNSPVKAREEQHEQGQDAQQAQNDQQMQEAQQAQQMEQKDAMQSGNNEISAWDQVLHFFRIRDDVSSADNASDAADDAADKKKPKPTKGKKGKKHGKGSKSKGSKGSAGKGSHGAKGSGGSGSSSGGSGSSSGSSSSSSGSSNSNKQPSAGGHNPPASETQNMASRSEQEAADAASADHFEAMHQANKHALEMEQTEAQRSEGMSSKIDIHGRDDAEDRMMAAQAQVDTLEHEQAEMERMAGM